MKPYSNPYVAGVGLGLVLLLSFVVTGRGLGASGGFGAVASTLAHRAGVSAPYFDAHLALGGVWRDWLVVELAGVAMGGGLSAFFAGRLAATAERGSAVSATRRLAFAGAGGAVMGFGAMLARGCTSGQALTGGALLSVGSWAFMLTAFAGAYAVAPFIRRNWR